MTLPRCYNCRRRVMDIVAVKWGHLHLGCPLCESTLYWPGNLDTTKPDLIKNPEAPLVILDGNGGSLRWHNGRQQWLPRSMK